MTNQRLVFAVVLVAGLLCLQAPALAADEEGFAALFNGKDMSGFKFIPPAVEKAFRVENGVIICSGKPNGYFATEKSYRNYILRLDLRYAPNVGKPDDPKVNSGILIHIQGEHKVWPQSIEVQGMNRDLGNVFAIAGAPKGNFKNVPDVQKKAVKPLGEWNSIEVTSQDGKLTSKVNGTQVGEGSSPLMEGPIGFQSEGVEIHFRNLRIKELK